MAMMLMPLARTTMDKKSGDAMHKYYRKVSNMLSDSIPWQSEGQGPRRQANVRGGQSGKMTVLLDAGESADFPLYKDAHVAREKHGK